METIATLDAAVQAQTAAVVALQSYLEAGGTHLSAADQSTLNNDVATITANTATLTTLATAPVAPVPPTA